MILAAHQPNFLPWMGFFDKMRTADLFVIVDHVQFERQNYQNRTRIKTADGARWLTIPVKQVSRDERIMDKQIDNSREGRQRWGRTTMLTLQHAYRSAPHFASFEAELDEIFEARWEKLLELNVRLIEFCRRALGIATPMMLSSRLGVEGSNTSMVLNMCRKVGADVYLSGAGGSRGYLDLEAFRTAGVRIAWQDFSPPRYRQHPSPESFIERLSALDYLANCGPVTASLAPREDRTSPVQAEPSSLVPA